MQQEMNHHLISISFLTTKKKHTKQSFKTHQLMHFYAGYSPTKAKGQEGVPLPKGKGREATFSLFYLLLILVTLISLLLMILLHLKYHSILIIY